MNGINKILDALRDDVDEKSSKRLEEAIGKKITAIELCESESGIDYLRLDFSDRTSIKIYDDGQNCCEHRYMTTDDTLDYFVGGILYGIAVQDASDINDIDTTHDEDAVHEVQFLEIRTDKGVFSIANHNEHNGYYGGFSIVVADGDEEIE